MCIIFLFFCFCYLDFQALPREDFPVGSLRTSEGVRQATNEMHEKKQQNKPTKKKKKAKKKTSKHEQNKINRKTEKN
jgi:hypothetical protein